MLAIVVLRERMCDTCSMIVLTGMRSGTCTMRLSLLCVSSLAVLQFGGFQLRDLPPELEGKWQQIQHIMASIVRGRMDIEPDHSGERKRHAMERQREGIAPNGEPSEPPSGPKRPWSFHYTERIHGGKRPWPFGKRAWHNFQAWAARLTVIEAPQRSGPTTLLECMLSYIAFAGGERFETGMGPEQNGHWVSVQVERFRSAWLSFQHLAGADQLLNDKIERQPVGSWNALYGLPKMVILQRNVDYPARKEVWDMISALPQWVAEIPPKACRGDERWRRWAPGMPGTQTREGQTFVAPRLWEFPLKRLKGKQQLVPWKREVMGLAAHIRWMHTLSQRGECSPSLIQLVIDEGAFTKRHMRACMARLYYEEKRTRALLHHNSGASMNKRHFADLWGAKERPKCVICNRWGYASRQMSWLVMHCEGWDRLGQNTERAQDATVASLRANLATISDMVTHARHLVHLMS